MAPNRFLIMTKNLRYRSMGTFCLKNFSIEVIDEEIGAFRKHGGGSLENEASKKI